jgi:hypothetical protein
VRFGRGNAAVNLRSRREGRLVLDLGGMGTAMIAGNGLISANPFGELARSRDLANTKDRLCG